MANKKGVSLRCPRTGGLGQGQHLFFLRRILRSKIQIPSAFKARAWRKGGVGGGNSASPELKRSPAACSVKSRSQQKSFLCLLEEKRGGARKSKIKKKTFLLAGERQRAAAGRSVRRSAQNRFGFRQTNAHNRKSQQVRVRLASLGDQIVRNFGRKNQLAVLLLGKENFFSYRQHQKYFVGNLI